MLINGVWRDNITCLKCKFRHPPDLTCAEAKTHAHRDKPEDAVACQYCGGPTMMKGTQLCDPCWELRWRIRDRPEIVDVMLQELRNGG